MVLAWASVISTSICWMRRARAGSKVLGTAMASLGKGSDVHTTSVAFRSSRPPSIMALRLRSKSVAQSTCPLATEISLAAWVAPSEYAKYSLGLMPLVLNHAVGISQPDVEPTSAKDTRLPLAPSGHDLTLPGPHTTIA